MKKGDKVRVTRKTGHSFLATIENVLDGGCFVRDKDGIIFTAYHREIKPYTGTWLN